MWKKGERRGPGGDPPPMPDTHSNESFLYRWMCWRRNTNYQLSVQEERLHVEMVELVDLPLGLSSLPSSTSIKLEELSPQDSNSPSPSFRCSSILPSYSELVKEIGLC